MDGFTRCHYCLRIVPVKDRRLGIHNMGYERPKCPSTGSIAWWVEAHSLDAMARDRQGVCMKCGQTVTNPDCNQCCREK